jgi:hypothetical protein
MDELAWPCGLIGKYFFNDEFKGITATDGSLSVLIDDQDISLPAFS